MACAAASAQAIPYVVRTAPECGTYMNSRAPARCCRSNSIHRTRMRRWSEWHRLTVVKLKCPWKRQFIPSRECVSVDYWRRKSRCKSRLAPNLSPDESVNHDIVCLRDTRVLRHLLLSTGTLAVVHLHIVLSTFLALLLFVFTF
jgi:hypothetical protein